MGQVRILELTENALDILRSDVTIGRKETSGIDLFGFIENLSSLLSAVSPDLRFDPAYPEYLSEKERDTTAKRFENALTWDVSVMTPANTGKPDRSPESGSWREATPRLRDTVTNDQGEQYRLEIWNMFAWVRFDVWAHTAFEAEKTAQWFQTFMMVYGGRLGSQQFRFHQRLRDRELLKINDTLQTRSLEYVVLLEEYVASRLDLIDKITVEAESIRNKE